MQLPLTKLEGVQCTSPTPAPQANNKTLCYIATHALECAQDLLAGPVWHVLHHDDGVLKAAATHHVKHAAHLLARKFAGKFAEKFAGNALGADDMQECVNPSTADELPVTAQRLPDMQNHRDARGLAGIHMAHQLRSKATTICAIAYAYAGLAELVCPVVHKVLQQLLLLLLRLLVPLVQALMNPI
jgi:hypothetical protein